jgi:hypothetical protein
MIGSQMKLRLSALRTSFPLPQRKIPGAIVPLEGLGLLKNPMTASGI